MPREVWGTFSVKDHLKPDAFIAEVMLYDRLVIPVPPKGEEDEWEERDWDPQKQENLLRILGNRVYKVEWTPGLREKWRTRYEAGKDTQGKFPDWAFHATRTQLTEELPRHITGVQAVSHYNSLDALQSDLSLINEEGIPYDYLSGNTVTAILAHEFLIPDDPTMNYYEVLKTAVKLSSKPVYKLKRRSFWRWQREFLDDEGITDMTAIKDAVSEMGSLIEEEKKIIRKSEVKTTLKFAFMVGSISLGLLGGPLTAVGLGGAFISLGQYAIDQLLQMPSEDPRPVSLFYDTKKHFGWK